MNKYGVRIGLALCGLLSSLSAMAQDLVAMNFRDADINSLIESVAEVTGRSFVVDPRVSGQITIISPEMIDADMFYQAFLSAIQVQGFQAVEDGSVVRIVPFNQAFGFLGGGGDNELETRLIKVENVDAQAILPVVKPLLSSASRLQAFADTNYLVVTDIRSNVNELEAIINEMDDPTQAALEVINLSNISAGEAVYIVNQLQLQQQGLTVVEDSLNNRLIISGPTGARNAFKTMLLTLDVPTSRAAGVEVIYLDYARAEEIKPIIDGMLQSEMFLLVAGETSSAEGQSTSAYRVEVDVPNNALVVAASPAIIREIRNVVDQLDISRPQVLIEAVIAEISEDQANRLSTQLAYANQSHGGYLTKFDSLLTTILGTAADGDVSPEDVATIGSTIGDTSNSYFVGGDFDSADGTGIGVLIQALRTDTSTRVLSTPSVVTLDNEEAALSIGEEVPFITGSFTTTGDSATNPFQTIEREEVGIKLTVLPQISKGDAIRLSLLQESSKLLPNASLRGTADVVTAKSTIETNVMVQDGELLILGGLIDGQSGNTETKVPILGDIPLLGGLFRSSTRSSDDRVLMMFIRPTILRNAESAASLSRERFDHLITLDREGEQDGGMLSEGMEEFLEQAQ